MTIYTEGFEGPASGAAYTTGNLAGGVLQKSAGATGTADTSTFFVGTKSARVQCPTAGTDFWYVQRTGLSDAVEAEQFAVQFVSLPNLTSATCKVLTTRSGSTNIAAVRWGGTTTSSGNLFTVTDVSGAVVTSGTSAAFTAGPWYLAEKWVDPGTTTSNGALWVRIWEDGSLFFDRQWSNLNLGTAAVTETRCGKTDSGGPFDGRFDFFQYNPGASGFIGYPATVKAAANAGDDAFLEPFANWQDGDGAHARAQLDASKSTYSGGTPTYTWSGPAGVSFTDIHDPQAQAILPQDVTTQTYAATLTEVVGSATDADPVNVTVAGSDVGWLRNDAVMRPARFVQL